jgi:hypothetical protein
MYTRRLGRRSRFHGHDHGFGAKTGEIDPGMRQLSDHGCGDG